MVAERNIASALSAKQVSRIEAVTIHTSRSRISRLRQHLRAWKVRGDIREIPSALTVVDDCLTKDLVMRSLFIAARAGFKAHAWPAPHSGGDASSLVRMRCPS